MKKKLLHLVFGGWINALLSGVLGIYVARALGPGEKGVLALALGSAAILSMLFGFGVPHASAYYIRAKPGSERAILRFMDAAMLLSCVFAAGLIGLGAGPFSKVFMDGEPVDGLLMGLMVGAVAIGGGNIMLQSALVAKGAARTTAAALNLGSLVALGVTPLCFHWLGAKAQSALFGTVLGQLAGNIFMRTRFGSPPGSDGGGRLDRREFLVYGLKAQSGALASLFFKRLDLFLIGYFLDTAAVGCYSIGLSLRDFCLTFARSLAGLVGGEIADLRSRASGRAGRLFKKGLLANLGFSVLMALCGAMVLPTAIPLIYGTNFQPAVAPSILILFSLVPFSAAIVVGTASASMGMPMWMSAANIAAAALGATSTWILTAALGLRGAAWATVASSVFLLFFQVLLFATKGRGRIFLEKGD